MALSAIQRPIHVTVAAANALYPQRADYRCDGVADNVKIQTAISAVTATGGKVVLSEGTYTLANTVFIPSGVQVVGSGWGATNVGGGSMTASMFSFGNAGRAGLGGMQITMPTTLTNDAITASGASYCELDQIRMLNGPNSASYYCISIANFFDWMVSNLELRPNCNGVHLFNGDNAFNYGNSTFRQAEIQLQQAGRIGWDIHGYLGAGVGNVNICNFAYISAVCSSANAAGSTGLKIRNASYMTFLNPDLEQCAVSFDISGNVSGGPGSRGNVLIAPYTDKIINIDADSFANTIIPGRVVASLINDAAKSPANQTIWLGAPAV